MKKFFASFFQTKEEKEPELWSLLPNEIILMIMKQLSPSDQLALGHTNHRNKAILENLYDVWSLLPNEITQLIMKQLSLPHQVALSRTNHQLHNQFIAMKTRDEPFVQIKEVEKQLINNKPSFLLKFMANYFAALICLSLLIAAITQWPLDIKSGFIMGFILLATIVIGEGASCSIHEKNIKHLNLKTKFKERLAVLETLEPMDDSENTLAPTG